MSNDAWRSISSESLQQLQQEFGRLNKRAQTLLQQIERFAEVVQQKIEGLVQTVDDPVVFVRTTPGPPSGVPQRKQAVRTRR